MSITAILWITLYISAAALSFVYNPLFGALGYLLEYYMRPELKWWGDELPDLRWNLIISVVLGVSFLIRRNGLPKMQDVSLGPFRWLIGLGAVMLVVTPSFAVDIPTSWDESVQWAKMALIFPLLALGVIRSRTSVNWFISANLLLSSWWGWNAWTHPKREAGRLVDIGSGDSLDDNSAAAHLLTILPFALILLLTEKSDKRVRAVALVATPLIINTIILCNSRGAIVGIVVALCAAMLLIRTGYRMRLVGAGVITVVVFLALADQQFLDRQQSTTSYEDDGSAQQRLETWRGGRQLVLQRPFGSGGKGFHLLSPIYIPSVVSMHGGELRAPHNTYVLVASEWGVLGLICYLGAYLSGLLMLEKIKRHRREGNFEFFYWRALAIQLGIIAYLVAGTFSDRLYAEAGYWLLALGTALYRLQQTELAGVIEAAPATQPALVLHPALRRWEPSHGQTRTR